MRFGGIEIVIILVLVLIIFGAGKLPKVMGDVGKGMRNFRDGLKSKEDEEADKNKDE